MGLLLVLQLLLCIHGVVVGLLQGARSVQAVLVDMLGMVLVQ